MARPPSGDSATHMTCRCAHDAAACSLRPLCAAAAASVLLVCGSFHLTPHLAAVSLEVHRFVGAVVACAAPAHLPHLGSSAKAGRCPGQPWGRSTGRSTPLQHQHPPTNPPTHPPTHPPIQHTHLDVCCERGDGEEASIRREAQAVIGKAVGRKLCCGDTRWVVVIVSRGEP
jgi:hypothetical protein